MNKIVQTSVAVAAASLALAACTANHPRAAAPDTHAAAPQPHAATPPPPANSRPATGVVAVAQPPGSSSPACAAERTWGTAPKQGGFALTQAPLYLVRAGQHECYDRVVFDLNGAHDVGYTAEYVPVVPAEGSGRPVPVAGGAALRVVIRGPIYGTDTQGHQPGRRQPAVGDDLVTASGWASLTEVAFAGSFEGQTTLAVGVHEVRPFRVWVRSERDYRHVVVDIAH
ncbi:MAG TPA: hypothetical protein VGL21_11775 [Jatrophihabitantaceae bacterium]|jgi:hypothetical protein